LGSPDDLVTQIGWRIARGMVLARQGKASEAETVARSGLELALSTEYASQTAEAHMALADVLRLAGRTDEAAEELERALAIYERKEFAASADAVRTELADLRAELGSSVP
ncbi:MAG TPA: tetratricopeptide repeat protein, partial [Gaiellaceae bacterium]|nr:tetratricopeptide repeat protein [Gaiellaceae bacterium]